MYGHVNVKLIFYTYICHFFNDIYAKFGHKHRPRYRQLVNFM